MWYETQRGVSGKQKTVEVHGRDWAKRKLKTNLSPQKLI